MPEFASEAELRSFASDFVARLRVGDVVLLSGPLGAGKTTFVRGMLEGLGFTEPVRSPTYNLVQTFATTPPLLHSDLYRVTSEAGLGLEDFLDDHLVCIEWPDRISGLVEPSECYQVLIDFSGTGRTLDLILPTRG